MTCKIRVIWPDGGPKSETWDTYGWRNEAPTNWQADFGVAGIAKAGSPTKTQIGGDHYLKMKIQPLKFSMANNLDACQHSIMKYITRRKGDKTKRLEDIDKAMHVLEYYKTWIEENE